MNDHDLRSWWTRYATVFWQLVLVLLIAGVLTASVLYGIAREIRIWSK